MTGCAAAVNGCWHWLWQKLSCAGVATVTWMTPLVSCRGTIWSNQTRFRLGWLFEPLENSCPGGLVDQ